jgi:hypothetical protein
MNVLASLTQTMLLGFTPPARACRGTCYTLETDFRRGRRPFCYPNPGVTLRTCLSDRRHLRCRHVRDPMTDNANFSEFRNIQHWRQLLRRTLEAIKARLSLEIRHPRPTQNTRSIGLCFLSLGKSSLEPPGTGFFRVETTPRKMPTACRGTEKRKGGDKKARQWRANVASLHKVLDTQTGWWS